MPKYDAQCKPCDIRVEYEAKMSERESALPNCPKCNKKMETVFAAQGGTFILKGRGWAKDGYK